MRVHKQVRCGHGAQFGGYMDEISWRVELSVNPGQLENFKALTGMMVEMSKDEPGTLSYQRFVTDDGRSVHLYERYIDSVAALMHLHVFTKHFGERFMSMAHRESFLVFGSPSDELKRVLDGLGAVYLKPLGDFKYWA
jgi:quinol monooxygenase YgiN